MTTDQQTTAADSRVEVGGIATDRRDPILKLGYALLGASAILFLLFPIVPQVRKDFFTIFCGHYIIAVVYAVALTGNRSYGIRRSWRKENIHKTVILLNLFLLAAFALNREFTVFEVSADWWSVYIVTGSLALLSFRYFDRLPTWANKIQFVLLGSALLMYVYASVFVVRYYALGAVGMLFFGIGGLIFVPFCLLVLVVALAKHHHGEKQVTARWMMLGAAAPLLFVAAYISEWTRRADVIEKIANQSVLHRDTQLPVWVRVAQVLEDDWMTRQILKSDLVYATPKDRFSEFDLTPNTMSWNERHKHDPLVFLATGVRDCSLPDDERIRILNALAKTRHMSEERLWNGDNLSTAYIVTDVDVYPDLRLAYTEKYFNIKNSGESRWRDTEEAIYTFQLPEGSVVTSLSLWIDGKEEKAILTSKQKATQAYTTIVGREARDPSVVHWQEGNTVTVRVFPCTTKEERKFKIGITSPLITRHGQVVYKSIPFEGPDARHARETMRLTLKGTSAEIAVPPGFKKNDKGDYIAESRYNPEWHVALGALPLKSGNTFSFDGYSYSMETNAVTYEPFQPGRIYLDINKSWTTDEVDTFHDRLADNLYAFDGDEFVKLTEENWQVVETLRKRAFSLFPFHLLNGKRNPLVVTKGKALSVHLSDFKESPFANRLTTFFASGKRIHVYNLDEDVSTYIQSLREFRALQFAEGSAEALLDLLDEDKFPTAQETANSIVLHDANLRITRHRSSDNVQPNSAPDHLARLFTYNDILRRIGPDYFKSDFTNEALVEAASKAYVVSPVSSLIVLETKADYDRFNIHDSKNSLHNAVKDSSGAVPEPHEWALIIVFAAFVIYLKVRRA